MKIVATIFWNQRSDLLVDLPEHSHVSNVGSGTEFIYLIVIYLIQFSVNTLHYAFIFTFVIMKPGKSIKTIFG